MREERVRKRSTSLCTWWAVHLVTTCHQEPTEVWADAGAGGTTQRMCTVQGRSPQDVPPRP